ncbi:PEPxxWA-CTERM sorting domain-containing protein [Sphingomonas endolithica]|uniref:PEPxxWA-CTERM sorting domain-containing protein n=1 Tax=Sphingomonas endolithica TaxID=2972485 RepID=UPI0021B06058|nr:PEPxxWA-CTERM sorting domain-containing protein [Sphingomonas sp. ZFBP2030]
MNLMTKFGIAAVMLAGTAGAAEAATTIVTPKATTWRVTTGTANSAKITGTEAHSGDGSLELKGDVSRFTYDGTSSFSSAIASLADVRSLTFDWRIAGDTVSALNPDYTPALRLNIKNGILQYGELIWEGVYNGVYGATTVPDTWYSTDSTAKFYFGRGNENGAKTLAEWTASMGTWDVVGISVGQGSSAGAGFHAFADNVTLATTRGSTTYNFEATANGAVPEPATWAMMILGMGAVGFAMRRRMKVSEANFTNKVRAIAAA